MRRLALGCKDVHIWQVSLSLWTSQRQRLYTLLSPDERVRAARYRLDFPRERFVIARGILRLLLSRYLGLSPESITFAYTPCGKPILEMCHGPTSEFLPPLHFNLSHSENLVLYAFVLRQQIGVDVERVRPVEFVEKRVLQFFSAREQGIFSALPEEDRLPAFFRAWTRKEAYIKARGQGFMLPFNRFDVSLDPTSPPVLLADRRDPQAIGRWWLWDIDVGEPYMAALAIECGEDMLPTNWNVKIRSFWK